MISSEITGSSALYLYGNSGRTYLFDMGPHVCPLQHKLFIEQKWSVQRSKYVFLDQLLYFFSNRLAEVPVDSEFHYFEP